ncbi:MAG: diguanylate cyclase [Selenomonas sp.]|uniref:transporter substrate-binding domain-containing diguanylate cyclase n=1 Tax=Selenomonas sp. TaxID=2053611 RepID=UPI0025E07D7F|nr:GGDEF domain-containing protein [Selenomonas sp.]MCR5757039.1 diguanylate cyclase [Selenomonas sp.]
MKALLTLIIALTCLLFPISTAPAASANENVKLGFIQPDNSLVNAHMLRQYYINYLDELSKQTDWDYKLVNIQADTAFTQLFTHDIDLLLSVEYPSSLGLHNGVIYSSMNFGYDVEGLYTRNQEDRFNPQDLNTLQGAKVGIIANRPINEKFEQFQQNNRLTFIIREYPAQKEMITALQAGEVDIVVDTATNVTPDESFLVAYTRVPVRIATTEEHRKQLNEIEQAYCRLNIENPHFEPLLNQTLAGNLDFQLVHYTPMESQFIRELSPLRIAIYGGSRPYIEYDERTQTASGLYPDLISAIAENSGLKFTYVHVSTYQDAMELLEKGDADIMLNIFAGLKTDVPLYYTNPLTEIAYSFIGKVPQAPSADERISMVVPHPEPTLIKYLREKYPRWDIQAINGAPEEALELVSQGTYNLALIRNSTLEIDRPLILYPNLTIIPDASINIPVSLAISPSQSRILQGIINKAITQINPEKRKHINQKHIIGTKPIFSLRHLLTFYPLQTGLTAGLILLLLAVMFFLSHHQRTLRKTQLLLQQKNLKLLSVVKELNTAHQKQRHYQELAETDALTGLLNKAAIERAGGEILSTATAPHCYHALFIVDLDYFKEANDSLGHQKGDDILRRFGLGLSHIVRSNDAVGRFGGDEFILVLANIPQPNIEIIAQRISEAAHNLEPATEKHPRLSASIGIALYPPHGHDYQELLHQADQALYQVKEKGRDDWSMPPIK